jgi:hypothetical protein
MASQRAAKKEEKLTGNGTKMSKTRIGRPGNGDAEELRAENGVEFSAQ